MFSLWRHGHVASSYQQQMHTVIFQTRYALEQYS